MVVAMPNMPHQLLLLYCLFALASTAVNLCTQIISISDYSGYWAIEASILIGTIAGLPVRYFLDKRYIFSYQTSNITHEGTTFFLYVFMSIFTTLIFWLMEYGFHLLFEGDTMRYLGGILGLSIGYYIKYKLDKRYVFTDITPGTTQ